MDRDLCSVRLYSFDPDAAAILKQEFGCLSLKEILSSHLFILRIGRGKVVLR